MSKQQRIVIGNAFSLSMISTNEATIKIKKISAEEARQLIQNSNNNILSIVGHEGTAAILTQLLGVNVTTNRVQYQLNKDDILIVFQLMIRLPEGKILTAEEVQQLISQGKAVFYQVQLSY